MDIPGTFIPLAAALVSSVFAALVLRRFRFSPKSRHLLLWGIGMIFYAIGGYAEAWYGAFGYHNIAYKLWYLSGAILVAAWLGEGTVFLLWKERGWAKASLWVLLIASFLAAGLVMEVTPQPQNLAAGELTGAALPSAVRLLTPFFNIYGTLFLAGGALYSAWIFYRKRVLLHRTLGNILIAAGAFAPAIGGTLNRFGTIPYALYVGELVGAILMFAGFLRATTPMKDEQPENVPQPV
jgi:hypothetical protein